MLNDDKDGLSLFDRFQTMERGDAKDVDRAEMAWENEVSVSMPEDREGVLARVWGRLTRRKADPEKSMRQVKGATKSLLTERRDGVARAVEAVRANAEAFGQKALVERLDDERERVEKELRMIELGVDGFVSEADVVRAVGGAEDSSIRLDWLKNFARPLPSEVSDRLRRVENARLFDNYVVMHCDPEKRNAQLTKKEIERKRDPILFGVLKCSRRLYFLADWVDEFCDLTLDSLLRRMGRTEARNLDAMTMTTPDDRLRTKPDGEGDE